MSTKPSPAPVKNSAAISRRSFLATSAAAGGALVVGLTLHGRLHLPSSEASQDPLTRGSVCIPTDRPNSF
jgi:hypothetical protein